METPLKVGVLGALGVRGNVGVQERLLGYLRGGRLHPAILLTGPTESNAWDIARKAAQFLLCRGKNTPGDVACGKCSSCRRVETEIHPDLLAYRSLDDDTLKIDQVRELCHDLSLSSVEGAGRVCLIDECHRMNGAAANAFLKTLEEPGEGRSFWLISSQPGSLLPTILSRCIRFNLQPVTAEGDAAAPDVTWDKLWKEASASKNPSALVSAIETKEDASAFLGYLQSQLRTEAVATAVSEPRKAPLRLMPLIDRFEETLRLEGRLRSNASYALMLESFLLDAFAEST